MSTPSTAPAASRNTTPSQLKTTGKATPNPPFARLLEASFHQQEQKDENRKRNRSESPLREFQGGFQLSDAGSELDLPRDLGWEGSNDEDEYSEDVTLSEISSVTGKRRRIEVKRERCPVCLKLTL